MQLRPLALLSFTLLLAVGACHDRVPEASTSVDPISACRDACALFLGGQLECVMTFAMVRVPEGCAEAVETARIGDIVDRESSLGACLPPCDRHGPIGCVGDQVEVCGPFRRKLRLGCEDLCALRGLRYTGTCDGAACSCEVVPSWGD